MCLSGDIRGSSGLVRLGRASSRGRRDHGQNPSERCRIIVASRAWRSRATKKILACRDRRSGGRSIAECRIRQRTGWPNAPRDRLPGVRDRHHSVVLNSERVRDRQRPGRWIRSLTWSDRNRCIRWRHAWFGDEKFVPAGGSGLLLPRVPRRCRWIDSWQTGAKMVGCKTASTL